MSEYQYECVFYDSIYDCKSYKIFRKRRMNHKHLYFFIVDSDYNVFCYYHNGLVNRDMKDIYCEKSIFV